MGVQFIWGVLFLCSNAPASTGVAPCRALASGDSAWRAIDARYGELERAQRAKDARALFALYTPDFEAHMRNGEVWRLPRSAGYSEAGFAQVRKTLHLADTIIGMTQCAPDTVTATVIQQWTRRQSSVGKVRLYETTTVQDETWVRTPEGWKRRLVANERPGAWYVDGKRVDPDKPYDPGAPAFKSPRSATSPDHPR